MDSVPHRIAIVVATLTCIGSTAPAAPHAELVAWEATPRMVRALPDPSEPNPVLYWNAVALELTARNRRFPPTTTRHFAMLHLAMHDAAMVFDPIAESYLAPIERDGPASLEAALTVAARDVLLHAFPADATELRRLADERLAQSSNDATTSEGMRIGALAAARMIAHQTGDGTSQIVDHADGTLPGEWRPTRPDFRPALLPQWPGVLPFAMESGAQFRLPPPPPVTSETYAADQLEVQSLGEYFSTARTAEQTAIAIYWADGPGTFTPPGHWNAILANEVRERSLDVVRSAWLFAVMNVVQADAAIACWDSKYAHNLWRPITAIPLADTDGNEATVATPGWTSYLYTPQFPEYPSGHSTFSGAGAAVIERFFGEDEPVRALNPYLFDIYGVPNETRAWPNAAAAAEEAGLSRIYGGIHYRFSKASGIAQGRALATHVLGAVLEPIDNGRDGWMLR